MYFSPVILLLLSLLIGLLVKEFILFIKTTKYQQKIYVDKTISNLLNTSKFKFIMLFSLIILILGFNTFFTNKELNLLEVLGITNYEEVYHFNIYAYDEDKFKNNEISSLLVSNHSDEVKNEVLDLLSEVSIKKSNLNYQIELYTSINLYKESYKNNNYKKTILLNKNSNIIKTDNNSYELINSETDLYNEINQILIKY